MPFRPWLCVSVSRCGKRGGKILKDVSRKAVGRRWRPGSAQRDQAHHVSGEHRYKHRHTEQHTCWEPRSVETWEGEEITSSLVCVPTISHRAGKASGPLEDECAEPPSIYCCCYCCCPSGRSRASRNANSNIRMRNHHQRSGCVLYQNHHHLSDVRSPGGGRNSPKSCENYICIEIGCLNQVWQGRLGWVSHTSQRTKSGAQASFYRLARNATLQCELRKQHPVAPGTIFTPALRSKRMEYFSSFFWDFPGQVWGKSSFSVSKIVCARS